MKRVTNGFQKLSLPKFSDQLWFIINSMTGNADFPNQQTAVQALTATATTYDELADKAKTGDRRAKAGRDATQATIVGMLHKLGKEVTAVAQDDVDLYLSSGFPFTQQRKTSPNMYTPDAPKVTAGVNKGEIDCKTTAQPGLKSVNFYIATDAAGVAAGDAAVWMIYSYNKVKYTFTGLTAGQRYFIKVGLVGVRGQEVISDYVSYIAQ